MTDQDNLRDRIADGVLRMHRIIGTTGRTGRVVCCSCDRTWRDHAQYQRHLAQAIIDEFGLTVETKKQTYPAPGAEQFEHATVSYDHEHSQWQATDEYGNDISDAYNDWIRNLPVEYSIVGKWKKHE